MMMGFPYSGAIQKSLSFEKDEFVFSSNAFHFRFSLELLSRCNFPSKNMDIFVYVLTFF
jgi:hypothetical protein